MPKSFSSENAQSNSGSEIDKSIEDAMKNQGERSEFEDDSHITGSENLWESSAEMHQITGKLTRDKNWKSPAQKAKEKKLKEKLERQKIREEILAAEPVTEMDAKLFSGYLAEKSIKSKSQLELEENQQKKKEEAKRKSDEAARLLKEKEDHKKALEKRAKEQEDEQIKAGNMARIAKSNQLDMQSIDDLKSLEKLSGDSQQVQGLTEGAEQDEADRQHAILDLQD